MNSDIVKLICITSEKNNNKFYIMKKLSDGNWEANWGRVKGNLNDIKEFQKQVYPSYEWQKKYNEKIKKGYEDVTHLYEEIIHKSIQNNGDGISIISDTIVRQLIYDLKSYANNSIKSNYTISTESVTQKMIDEAQIQISSALSLLNDKSSIGQINSALLRLYKIIPRKMNHVSNFLISSLISKEDFDKANKMLQNEQDTLDVMAGQVKLIQQQKEADKTLTTQEVKDLSILDQMGLNISVAGFDETKHIKHLLNNGKIRKVFKVTNNLTESKYSKLSIKKEEFFWHGSRNQNWFNIIQTGLLIRPSGAITTGAMFGSGVYFANRFEKSLGYSSLSGSYWANGRDNKAYLAIFKVNVGNQKHIHKHDSSCYSLSQKNLQKDGFDSVYAHSGIDLKNDEFIIYDSNRCSIAYLVEITN